MREEGRDWERKGKMLRDAEMEMGAETKRGCRETEEEGVREKKKGD